MMPIMDGRSFRERQLQTPELASIPVIVFSAYRDVAKTATELNAAGHLPKPLKLTDLLRAVRSTAPTRASRFKAGRGRRLTGCFAG